MNTKQHIVKIAAEAMERSLEVRVYLFLLPHDKKRARRMGACNCEHACAEASRVWTGRSKTGSVDSSQGIWLETHDHHNPLDAIIIRSALHGSPLCWS